MGSMKQNKSMAVMQNLHDRSDMLQNYPTPPWATRALCEVLKHRGFDLSFQSVREPAAGQGHMARPLGEYFKRGLCSDAYDYGAEFPIVDYLAAGDIERTDWTITNPPFRLAQPFIEQALKHSRVGVAMLTRVAFLEGVKRHAELFEPTPPSLVLQFSERVPMVRGRYDPKASTATAYCWLVWMNGCKGTAFEWIAPCRKRLERPEDFIPFQPRGE
jgi:hypothetical protein